MFCTSCGAKNADDAAFCKACGVSLRNPDSAAVGEPSLKSSPSQSFAVEPAKANPFVQASAAPAVNATAPKGPKNKKPLVIGIVAAVVVICLIIAGVVWFNVDQTSKARRAPHSVIVSINAEGYTDADTLIPIQASGTDMDGHSVDELFFVDASGRGVSLPKGSYTLSIPASPLTVDGILYQDVTATYPVVVPDDIEDGADVDAAQQANIEMKKSTALDQTQDMIDRATDLANKDENQTAKAEELSKKAQQVHDEAVAQKQHEEEVAQARQNPDSVNAMGGPVTLKGKLVRRNLTTDDTGMGWAMVLYSLQLDTPVTITYPGPDGQARTNSFSTIQVGGKEIYIASNPNANSMLGSESDPSLQPYVGQYIAVTGKIFDSGTMHTFGNARFSDISISVLPS